MEDDALFLKILVFGENQVGKSSLISRLCDSTFQEAYSCSIGIGFKLKDLKINGNNHTLQFWDISGSESHDSLSKLLIRNTDLAIFVADAHDFETYLTAVKWKEHLRLACKKFSIDDIPCIFCLNKIDVVSQESFSDTSSHRRITSSFQSLDFLREFSQDCYFVDFVTISCMNGQNIGLLMEKIRQFCAKRLKNRRISYNHSALFKSTRLSLASAKDTARSVGGEFDTKLTSGMVKGQNQKGCC